MSREKKDYRANIELLNNMFPNVAMLNENEVMQAIGCKDRRTVKKYLGKLFAANNRISKAALARWMCGE